MADPFNNELPLLTPSATLLPPVPKKSSLRRAVFGKDKKGKEKAGGGAGDTAAAGRDNVKFSLVEAPEDAETLPLLEGEDPSKYRQAKTSISRRTKKKQPLPPAPRPEDNDLPQYSQELRNTGVDPSAHFQYHFSAVAYQHPRTDDDLRTNIHWKIEQIQCTRNEVSVLLYRLDDLRRMRDSKRSNVQLMEEDREQLQLSLVREMELHLQANELMVAKEQRLKRARRRKALLDNKDKYVMQLYDRVHSELASSMRGYNQCYSTVMCELMHCLELWNGLQEAYLEASLCLRQSQQKAKQAFHATSLKYKRFKTIRENLSRDLKTLKKQGKEEDINNRAYYREVLDYEQARLRKYYDKLRCCLIQRDLRYEALLEKKDLLSAKVKVQIALLHKYYMQLKVLGEGAIDQFELLMETRKMGHVPFRPDTMTLLQDLAVEDDYASHLEAIELTLLGYTGTIREQDRKRECLLRDRAHLMGINPADCVPIPTPCPYIPKRIWRQ